MNEQTICGAVRREILVALRHEMKPRRGELGARCPSARNAEDVSVALSTLARDGFVEKVPVGRWQATEAGRAEGRRLAAQRHGTDQSGGGAGPTPDAPARRAKGAGQAPGVDEPKALPAQAALAVGKTIPPVAHGGDETDSTADAAAGARPEPAATDPIRELLERHRGEARAQFENHLAAAADPVLDAAWSAFCRMDCLLEEWLAIRGGAS